MKRSLVMAGLLAGAGIFVCSGLEAARAETLFEVENARGNARAGRPLSAHQEEILERWGALSGTPGWRSRGLNHDGDQRPRRHKAGHRKP